MSTEELRTSESSSDFEMPVQLFAMDGARETITGRLRRVNNGFYQLRSTLFLEPGRKIVLGLETCRVELEVVYCQRPELGPCYLGARVIATAEAGIRKEIRLPVEIPAKVNVPGIFDHEDAIVVDISSSGLGLQIPSAVEVGSIISVDIGKGIVFGQVRHCIRKSSGAFQAGITIEEFITRDHPLALEKKGGEIHSVFSLLRKLKNSLFSSD